MIAFTALANSKSLLLISLAAPISTPHVGCEIINTFGLAFNDLPTINFCKFPPDNWSANGFDYGHLTSLSFIIDIESFDDILELNNISSRTLLFFE